MKTEFRATLALVAILSFGYFVQNETEKLDAENKEFSRNMAQEIREVEIHKADYLTLNKKLKSSPCTKAKEQGSEYMRDEKITHREYWHILRTLENCELAKAKDELKNTRS